MSDAGVEVIAQLATLDPQLRERVLRLANLALDEAEFMLRNGEPRIKTAIIRQMTSAMAKHLSHSEQNDELEEMRKEMAGLRKLILGRTPGFMEEDEVEGEAEVDRPNIG